jgi:hypothetical protein
MNASPLPEPGATAGRGLHTRRCVRHDAREAAARCPECQGYFCRECVIDHRGRFLCANCLAKTSAKTAAKRKRWEAALRLAIAVCGVFVAWLAFYSLGATLLKIPAAVHEGTIWHAASSP